MKVTAQWIADQCGVSRGTVDRVVNGRPNVSPEVRERIQKLISEYGYKTPSQRQAARAGRGVYRIGVILPSWDAFFIRRMRDGIRTAVHNRGLNDVSVLVEELKNRLAALVFRGDKPHGGAGHRRSHRHRAGYHRHARGNRPSCCGRHSGRHLRLGRLSEPPPVPCRTGYGEIRPVAAGLLAPYAEGGEILVVTGNREFAAHDLRVRGFLDRLHEIYGDTVAVNVIESVEKYDLTYDGVMAHTKTHPRLRGIYMANESVRGCMDALERAKPARRVHVVCHDLTPYARKYLEEGRLDFIIDQDFSTQTTRAIEVLAHTLRTGETPRQNIEYIHTSIITRELL